MEEAKRFISSE